jgi:hypothetical protein
VSITRADVIQRAINFKDTKKKIEDASKGPRLIAGHR